MSLRIYENQLSEGRDDNKCDGDTSAKESPDFLFKCFCNNLYLGQWQLARAVIPQIKRVCKDKPISEILKDVSCHPFDRR